MSPASIIHILLQPSSWRTFESYKINHMSAPVSSFRTLSISDAMEASGGKQRLNKAFEKGKARATPLDDDTSTDTSSSDGEEDESDAEDENGTHLLALDHCRQIGSRYAFQMVDAKVRKCGIRLEENMKAPTCSCNGGGDCRHTQWLLDHLSTVRNNSPTKRPVSPYEYITSKGLGSICKTLKWEFREESEEHVGEYPWALQKDYAVKAPEKEAESIRIFKVRDIMASFSSIPTNDFRVDIFKNISVIHNTTMYIPDDLEGTLIYTLLNDSLLFNHFDSLVSSDVRATKYFQNMNLKAHNTVISLDNYCDGGPSHAGGAYDVIWCAQTLTDIVQAIHTNLSFRQPLSTESRIEAAKALLTILVMVVKHRNHDAYQNLTWKRPRKHGEPQIDRNLYQRLIGSNPAGEMFVLSALRDLPEAAVFLSDLEECLSLLEAVGWSAPRLYLEKLREIIARCKSTSVDDISPPGSSRSKRAGASGMEGKVKRMK